MKRAVSLLLVLVVLFSFAACGPSEEELKKQHEDEVKETIENIRQQLLDDEFIKREPKTVEEVDVGSVVAVMESWSASRLEFYEDSTFKIESENHYYSIDVDGVHRGIGIGGQTPYRDDTEHIYTGKYVIRESEEEKGKFIMLMHYQTNDGETTSGTYEEEIILEDGLVKAVGDHKSSFNK